MADLYHQHAQNIVFQLADDSVVANTVFPKLAKFGAV